MTSSLRSGLLLAINGQIKDKFPTVPTQHDEADLEDVEGREDLPDDEEIDGGQGNGNGVLAVHKSPGESVPNLFHFITQQCK